MQQNDQEMRKLTRMLARRSERMINAGSELNLADFGDDLQKGMEKFDRFRTPRLDSFDKETTGGTAELPSYSAELEMAPIGDDELHRS
jgi:hypothetical protein